MDNRKTPISKSLAVLLKLHIILLSLIALASFSLQFVEIRLVPEGLISVLFLVFFFAAVLFSLYKKVYRPIHRMEDAMDLLSQGDNDIFESVKLEPDNAVLSMHFSELIQLLKDSIDREYTSDYLKKEAELNALQSQINPHFLYNVLDAIRGHALNESVPEIAEMTEALSKLFRYSVSHWESEVTLERELINVRSYFKIQQYRFNNRFDLRVLFDADESTALSCRMPKLTLQPVIENAIYHGLEMKMDRGMVTIRIKVSGKLLLIEVSDDGVGVEQDVLDSINSSFVDWRAVKVYERESSGTGIALTNVNSRIKMMYGEDYGLYMYSTKGYGTTIEILLPFIE